MIRLIVTSLMICASALPAEAEEGPLYDFTLPGGRQPNWQEIELQKQNSCQHVVPQNSFKSQTSGRETQKLLESLTEFGKPFQKSSIPNALPVEKLESVFELRSKLDTATNLPLFKIPTNPFEETDPTIVSALHFDRFTISSMWEREWCKSYGWALPDGACGSVNLHPFNRKGITLTVGHLMHALKQTAFKNVSDQTNDISVSDREQNSFITEDLISIILSIQPRMSRDNVDSLLSEVSGKIGEWEQKLSSIRWLFYEIGEITWIFGIDPQNQIVNISTESSIPQWPEEITILYDRYSVEPTVPASTNIESIFNAF